MDIRRTAGTEQQPPFLARRLSRRQLIVLDGAAVLAYTAVLLLTGSAGSAPAPDPPSDGPSPWEPLVLMAAIAVPIAVRRVWPLPVFGVVTFVTAVAVARDAVWDPLLPAASALYTVALTSPLRRWWERWLPYLTITLLCLTGALGAVRAEQPYWQTGGPGLLLLGFAVLLGAWELGGAVRQRRAYAARVAEHLAQRAVAEERLRIARELHDVVTHSMGLIAVEAGVANHVVRTRPEEAHDALRVIESTSRDALTDMRRMLGVLRSDADGARLPPAARGPVPGPGDLARLAERAGAELSVRDVEGLPDGVGLTVYRIVQEALTNVIRHAPAGAPCRVVVEANRQEVRIDVTNDGGHRAEPAPPGSGGHGIVGMRERVAMYGGTFAAGPRPQGGFAVTATVPYGNAR
ncbi:sensor histidine kinase [Streptomyces nigrescens]|uniref:sensor histidine kinase n=1 Tax=Streptomyces nigrescens TaxID=1920 RepID=UPI0021C46298|nr:sensor histidine kinase [Streptomyces nigrescens]